MVQQDPESQVIADTREGWYLLWFYRIQKVRLVPLPEQSDRYCGFTNSLVTKESEESIIS